jgi:hypothetical protein
MLPRSRWVAVAETANRTDRSMLPIQAATLLYLHTRILAFTAPQFEHPSL